MFCGLGPTSATSHSDRCGWERARVNTSRPGLVGTAGCNEVESNAATNEVTQRQRQRRGKLQQAWETRAADSAIRPGEVAIRRIARGAPIRFVVHARTFDRLPAFPVSVVGKEVHARGVACVGRALHIEDQIVRPAKLVAGLAGLFAVKPATRKAVREGDALVQAI